jgi:hypothetical protein
VRGLVASRRRFAEDADKPGKRYRHPGTQAEIEMRVEAYARQVAMGLPIQFFPRQDSTKSEVEWCGAASSSTREH